MIRKAVYILCVTSFILSNDEFSQRSKEEHYANSFPIQSQTIFVRNDLCGTALKNIESPYSLVTIIGSMVCVKKIYEEWRHAIIYKKWLKSMSYDDFKDNFAELLSIEERIMSIQNLLQLSKNGTLPEQIYARIHLARSRLPCPYDKVTNKCVKKYYETNFDEQGHFVWKECDEAERCYKKFYSKVPQNFRALASCSKKIKSVKKTFASAAVMKTENVYNQTLLDMIYAGIKENFPLLHKILRSYYDTLLDRLYWYYVDAKSAALLSEELQNNDMPISNEYKEKIVLQHWYEEEMLQWLTPKTTNNTILREVIHEVLLTIPIMELPMMPHYRFFLLRKFMEKACDTECAHVLRYKELFDAHGILKKYASCISIEQHEMELTIFEDPAIHKALNFALAISEKERDEVTNKVAKQIELYVYYLSQAVSMAAVLEYKDKIALLYDALSHKKYEPDILEICKKN